MPCVRRSVGERGPAVSEPSPANCKKCGKVVLSGLVEEIYPMRLDGRPIPYPDAKLLHSYGIPVVEVLLSKVGANVQVVMSRMLQESDDDEDPTGWVALMPHRCLIEAWLRSGA